MENEIEIRECETLEQLAGCVDLQRDVFALPEVELSPVRHFVVTKNAGGFTLGAYDGDKLAGFVLSVPAIRARRKGVLFAYDRRPQRISEPRHRRQN